MTAISNGLLCVIYISEASSSTCLNHLTNIAKNLVGAKLVHSFKDITYNRTSFYLLGHINNPEFNKSALQLCSEAYKLIDFSVHNGTHPALGSVDHVCFSPLVSNDDTLDKVGECAKRFASSLSNDERIPVFTYGMANDDRLKLRDIRRNLGYFEPIVLSEDSNLGPKLINLIRQNLSKDTFKPTYGDDHADNNHNFDKKGVMCIGSVPMIINYNMRFRVGDSKNLVMQVTKHCREEGIGVEALTLQHNEGSYEVACNLTNVENWGPDKVFKSATNKAKVLGIDIVDHYTTGPSLEELQEIFSKLIDT